MGETSFKSSEDVTAARKSKKVEKLFGLNKKAERILYRLENKNRVWQKLSEKAKSKISALDFHFIS